MPIATDHVRQTVNTYLSQHPDEKDRLSALLEVLDATGDRIATRTEFRGHVTAGAVLLRPDGRVLQIEHKALRKWLLPGGHTEDSDTSLLDAALRELSEETGIGREQVEPEGITPIDIDVHPIPANDAKGEPEHQHFDFRFLFRTTADAVALQVEEVTNYGWTPADMLASEHLRARVLVAAGR
ncbi:NUDIX domain-containing protein [Streptomyces sp. 8K308]|uniref:NUDIX hydrolase n=1 Tax=Streptomyces sp. 8K308 TaxID=2530388 RepID=UPI001051E95C|nr:NUDIX hydrolase [Streptomyces sp. 8K308]TDC13474.1 NUDIX domain-containing protein [Streptomyces sp. 8K308]